MDHRDKLQIISAHVLHVPNLDHVIIMLKALMRVEFINETEIGVYSLPE